MNSIQVVENNGKRILLTAQLAELYGTTTDTITKNFNRNVDRYQEGKHYYCLQGDDLRTFRANGPIDLLPSNLNKLYLWTEHGALLHAKSLGTDKAWDVYGELVDTYFRVRQPSFPSSPMTPAELIAAQANYLVQLEKRQKAQGQELVEVNSKVDNICDIITLNPTAWRDDCRRIVAKIAQARGGAYQETNAEIFRLVDERGGASLEVRLTNKRRRMAEEGACKSKRDRLTKVDVIAEDKRLIEVYLAVVKDMAIKSGVDISEHLPHGGA